MEIQFCRCCKALSRELTDGLCWNCTHGRCENVCVDCLAHFGMKYSDGTPVLRSIETATCSRCENAEAA